MLSVNELRKDEYLLVGFHQTALLATSVFIPPLPQIYTCASCSHPCTPKSPNSIQPPPTLTHHQLHPKMMTARNFVIIHHQEEGTNQGVEI